MYLTGYTYIVVFFLFYKTSLWWFHVLDLYVCKYRYICMCTYWNQCTLKIKIINVLMLTVLKHQFAVNEYPFQRTKI